MQYKKSVKFNKKANFAPLPPKAPHSCRYSPSLSTHRQCAPFLSSSIQRECGPLSNHCRQHGNNLFN